LSSKNNMLNKTINGYTIKRSLGEGGMAEVWYAENGIGKRAAVKVLKQKFCLDEQIVARFENEAKVMVLLKHPYIRQVYDYVNVDGQPCILMEYLEGDDLKARLVKNERLSDDRLQKWWGQLSDALNYTHQQGVIHRDIKPSNIFIDKYDNVKLMDFGIAKIEEYGGHTQTGVAMGTRIYMSPEQVRDPKRVKAATDSYSLAVTFVHLLTGKAPYDTTTSSDFDIQMAIVQEPLDLSSLSEEWQSFLQRYLAKKPEERPMLQHFSLTETKKDNISQLQQDSSPTDVFSEDATYIDNSEAGAFYPSIRHKNAKDLSFKIKEVTFIMKHIEGGTFEMGATPEQGNDAYDDEKPVHSVTVSDFLIGKTAVTQALWEAVMGTTVREQRNKANSDWEIKSEGANHPMCYVSWNEAVAFCNKLNEMSQSLLPSGHRFALPTEAQWEYAARGGSKSQHYKYAGSNSIGDVAWYRDNSGLSAHPVRSKQANELGLYDMSGNVLEWCSDLKGGYSSSAQTNPKGPSLGIGRVLRGGSWYNFAKDCRVSFRNSSNPDDRYSTFGFRIALVNE